MRGEKRLISIIVRDGWRTKRKNIGATVYGPLAVHPTDGEDGRWTITHVETGYAVATVLGSKKTVLALVSAIVKAKLDWITIQRLIDEMSQMITEGGVVALTLPQKRRTSREKITR